MTTISKSHGINACEQHEKWFVTLNYLINKERKLQLESINILIKKIENKQRLPRKHVVYTINLIILQFCMNRRRISHSLITILLTTYNINFDAVLKAECFSIYSGQPKRTILLFIIRVNRVCPTPRITGRVSTGILRAGPVAIITGDIRSGESACWAD